MTDNFLPFALPDIGDDEINEVVECLKSGWITTGPRVKLFEESFQKYVGSKYSLAVNSATSGLHLALDAIGLKAGDKVITTVNTFTASAEVIRYFKADPIFCDIDESTLNIDLSDLKKLLEIHCADENHQVKAIMPVHIAGLSCQMEEIMALAKKYNLRVIEDAAHALPSTCNGKTIGTIGDITVFSFYATKTITTGEGGMVVTNNDDYYKRMKIMRLHGFDRDSWNRYNSDKASWYMEIVAPGFKYNMPDILASIGIHQLKKADNFFEKRNLIAKKYTEAFENTLGITCPTFASNGDKHSFHLYIVKISGGKRDQFIEIMNSKGVGLSVHFIPLHLQPYWRDKYNLKPEDFPKALNSFNGIVSLPIYTKMSDSDINKVIESTQATLKELEL
jgi:dTDP-4-amino-4,6-dideoxygalactose transaminase